MPPPQIEHPTDRFTLHKVRMPPAPSFPSRNGYIVAGVLLALVWLLSVLAPVLAPFIAAAIVAYILNPLVIRLCALKVRAWHAPRTLASAVVILLLLVLGVGLALIVLPVLRTEAQLLQARLPALLEQVNTVWLPWLKLHLGITIALDTDTLKSWIAGLSAGDDTLNRALSWVKTGSTALLGFVGTGVLAVVLAFYLLMDWPELMRRIQAFIPRRWEEISRSTLDECDAVIGQYLRGQLAVMLALCFYYSIALWVAGFDVALPVGVLTGLLIVIPYLGFAFGLLLALAAALLQFQGANGLIWVAVIYGFGQALEGFFLTPRWVGASLGLHPAAVIFALLAFGQLLGFVGVLLALPLAALVVVVGKRALTYYQQSDWYAQK